MFDNQVWLALALIGTFLTIFALGLVVDMALNKRRQYATVLQTQVGAVPDSITNLRDHLLWSGSSSRSRGR